jgi:hypothetical protein
VRIHPRLPLLHAPVAQRIEHRASNAEVAGEIPAGSTTQDFPGVAQRRGNGLKIRQVSVQVRPGVFGLPRLRDKEPRVSSFKRVLAFRRVSRRETCSRPGSRVRWALSQSKGRCKSGHGYHFHNGSRSPIGRGTAPRTLPVLVRLQPRLPLPSPKLWQRSNRLLSGRVGCDSLRAHFNFPPARHRSRAASPHAVLLIGSRRLYKVTGLKTEDRVRIPTTDLWRYPARKCNPRLSLVRQAPAALPADERWLPPRIGNFFKPKPERKPT